jgi:hypothetical protein
MVFVKSFIGDCMKLFFSLFMFCVVLTFGTVMAFSVDGCHCFQHREFDPDNIFASDDYLMATIYNSLISSVFHVSKGDIILRKMKGGVGNSDLMIALYIADKTGVSAWSLLSSRYSGSDWENILNSSELAGKGKDDPIFSAVRNGVKRRVIDSLLTDYMLKQHYTIKDRDIEKARKYGLDDRGIVALFVLAKETGKGVDEIWTMFHDQHLSWSGIAHAFNLSPKEVGKRVLASSDSRSIGRREKR